MNDQDLNAAVNKFIKNKLSPKQEQREYISEKYEELCGFLSGNCFQTGSYARFTATDPVHDLDTVHPSKEPTIQDNPQLVIDSLLALIEDSYSKSQITKIKSIYAQTHSVTIEFSDSPEPFSIDVVPAIELPGINEYGDPLYLVPEILRVSKNNRQKRYEAALQNPIGWIKSDPRGYIRAASELNESNSNFRHAAKLLKAWRAACKGMYGDDFCLKSFHLEQIVYRYFVDNPGVSTPDAVIDCLAVLTSCLQVPAIPDRADAQKFIDDYVSDLTTEERQLILRLQADAYAIVRQLPACRTEDEVKERLDALLDVKRHSSSPPLSSPVRNVTPRQPWASRGNDVEQS